jgi:ATP/maltotriose-dependent transcriptional regulator MalT
MEIKAKECCYTCAKLYNLTCPESEKKCRKYEPAQLDKTALSTKYFEAIQKLIVDVKQLQAIELELKMAEKANLLSKIKEKVEVVQKEAKEPEEKPAISKRNKEIIALVEQGKGVKEIASTLNLKPETVAKELEYLLKNRMLKTVPS